MASPEFPLRVIFDDGEVEEIGSADELMEKVDTIDSTDPRTHIWIRDAADRTVRLRMRGGNVEVFETA
jgi:hypothetical protein